MTSSKTQANQAALSARFEDYRQEVESFLPSFMYARDKVEPELYLAMAYSFLDGGKRIRPVLLLATFDALSGGVIHEARQTARRLAAALEMIHSYSLIHDDLPSMDDDDLRRGKPTNHKQFGEAVAILAGDALLNLAYEQMTLAAVECGQAGATAAAWMAEMAGGQGMIGGQIIDLASEGEDIDIERLTQLHRQKTAALLRAAVGAAARLCLCDHSVARKLDVYALSLGLAFQIKDDILDVTSTSEYMGKSVGKDVRDQKATFVTRLGLEGAEARLNDEKNQALSVCKELEGSGIDSSFLAWMANWFVTRSY